MPRTPHHNIRTARPAQPAAGTRHQPNPVAHGNQPPFYCTEIHSPYNFVPLSNGVLIPGWQDSISHDLPFEDGLSGELQFEIEAETPLLVGAEKQGIKVSFFKHPDGVHAIPGSALRGMVRNVLEIATFSRIGTHVDDKWLAVRDLTSGVADMYREKMTDEPRHLTYEANSRAGWLSFMDGKWWIQACHHSRIEVQDLDAAYHQPWARDLLRCRDLAHQKKLAKQHHGPALTQQEENDLRRLNKAIRLTAAAKYASFLAANSGKLGVKFTAGHVVPQAHSGGKSLIYSKATSLKSGGTDGFVIFTGQPGNNKHMEFIFHGSSGTPIEVPVQVMQAFRSTHDDSDDWKWLQANSQYFPEGLPVFYLEERGQLYALGLAQMFKLKYTNSLHGAIRNASNKHLSDGKLDFAETLFGKVFKDDQAMALKGRVDFSDARLAGQPKFYKFNNNNRTILNGPKPTYYPNYIVQSGATNGGHLPTVADNQNHECHIKPSVPYRTLMNDDVKLRGWKRYPVRPLDKVNPQQPTPDQKESVQTELHPLDKGARFAGKLRFHNLKPAELGALVWALTWGGDTALRHSLGMGKPFGFGCVKLSLGTPKLIPNKASEAPLTLENYRDSFVDWMSSAYAKATKGKDWRACEGLKQLLGMANPANATGHTLEHMQLKNVDGKNEFVEAKKAGRVLQPYIR
jgi:CRISPR-associated protein (TIGR03986 family)